MATGGAVLLPSKEKTNFLRLAALIIDGGTLALKTQFDAGFPPQTLGQDLQAHGNYQILLQLKNQKILTKAQFNLLFPPPTTIVASSDFDVCLFTCLIQNLPAFHQQNSPVWAQKGPPAPTDLSLAADVKRLRHLRNKVSHPASAAMSDIEFQDRWQETSDVIQRLCTSIPDIQNYLASSQQLSIDPNKEQVYIDKLRQWEDFDLRFERHEKQIKAVQDSVNKHTATITTCETDIKDLKINVDQITIDIKSVQEECGETATLTKKLATDLEGEKKKIKVIQADQDTLHKMSSEFRAIVSRSTIFFEEKERNEFIETTTYIKAVEMLNKDKLVILSGHPGEGKTTMAKHLLRTRFQFERCINLREPADWKHLDFSLNLIDAIVIDDIFGCGVLDEKLARKWERKLEDLSTVIKQLGISVVITSRHYILEESKQLFRSMPLLKKESIILLSSKDLTQEEKIKILESHLKAEKRQAEKDEILMCVLLHSSVLETLLFGTNEFLFGFPECVNLFARQDELFEKGAEFFSRPYSFVKNCIHQLYRDEEKFLALIVMWANDMQSLKKSELDESQLSHRVKRISKQFNFKLKGKLIKRLRKSLDYHVDGLLHFSKETGVYSFSHNVISDMVGLVIAEENPDEILEFCTREFLLAYVTTQPSKDEFKFCVDNYLFNELAKRFVGLMMEEFSVEGLLECSSSLLSLHRGGKMENTVVPKFAIDFSIIKHDSFQNENFVDEFLNILIEKGFLENMFAREIMEMSGFFLRYGIKVDQQKYFLLSYSVFIGAESFAERIICRKDLDMTALTDEEKTMEYTMALFFAVHQQSFKLVKALVERGAILSEEGLYIAAHKADMNILRFLLERNDRRKIKNIEILNGNNPLIVAAKKGFLDAVQCFIDCGYDLLARNRDGLSAIDKAIVYKREDVCEILAKANVPLDIPTRKFKRTPLHTAVDLGLEKASKALLMCGANLKVKDHKGFFPIHSAALSGHFDIVRLLLEHDPSQANLRTKTYGKNSALKGKTVFHVALHKKDYSLLEVLLKTKANANVLDWYGRTPFLEAVLIGDKQFITRLQDLSDLNIPDKNGFTPLHAAVYNGYLKLVDSLCAYPLVNVNARDRYGKTPLHLAAIKGFSTIFITLVKNKADWRMITRRGDTSMHLAFRNREKHKYKCFIDRMASEFLPLRFQTDKVTVNNSVNNSDHTCASGSGVTDNDTVKDHGSDKDVQEQNKTDTDGFSSTEKNVSQEEQTPEVNNETSTQPDQESINILERSKTTTEGYNLILRVLLKLDMDFVQKGIANKYGQKIVFPDTS